MVIKNVRVSLQRSIKVDEFKYYKVGFEVELEIEKIDEAHIVIQQAKDLCKLELQHLIDEEKQHYRNQLVKVKYEKMLKQYAEGSTEYILAKEKLEALDGLNRSV